MNNPATISTNKIKAFHTVQGGQHYVIIPFTSSLDEASATDMNTVGEYCSNRAVDAGFGKQFDFEVVLIWRASDNPRPGDHVKRRFLGSDDAYRALRHLKTTDVEDSVNVSF